MTTLDMAEFKYLLRSTEWIALPSGQLVPPFFLNANLSHAQREALGFRWDGDTPVFPNWWPPSAEALKAFLEADT